MNAISIRLTICMAIRFANCLGGAHQWGLAVDHGVHREKRIATDGSRGFWTAAHIPMVLICTLIVLAIPRAMAQTAVPAAAAGVAQAGPDAAGVTHFAIGQRVCKAAMRRQWSCFAVRRVEVPEGTSGALPYKLAAGATPSAATTDPRQTIGPTGGLTPSDLATAYGFSSTATGAGQTVAIVDAYNDPNINSDLQPFD